MMLGNDDFFIEPTPDPPEHRNRLVKGYDSKPHDFEEVLADSGESEQRFRNKDEIRNFRWLYIIASLLLLALVGRGAFLQVFQVSKYRGLAEGNRLRSLTLSAPRGVLYDRFGEQLVQNVPSYNLVMVPADVPADEEERKALFKEIIKLFDIDPGKPEKVYSTQDRNSFNAVSLVKDVPRDKSIIIQSHPTRYPGVAIRAVAVRKYAASSIMAHVVGYIGKLSAEEYKDHQDYDLTDSIGKAGVELSYEKDLKGNNGSESVEVDALGQVVSVLGTKPSIAGSNLKLTIDLGLQKKLFESLQNAAKRSKEKRAAAVAINPQNGEILALVSIPSFDINKFAKGITTKDYAGLTNDPDQPLFNRPLSGSYSPGSTFKPFVATGSLAAGKIDENTTFFDTGVIEVGGQKFRGWKPGGHGEVNVIRAIANSVNGFFFSIGGGYGDIEGLGIRAIDKIASAFGFGSPLGVDLPGEAGGLLPTPDWKKKIWQQSWFLGDTYNASIGQGFVLVTPLQLVDATAAIANGGTLWWPHMGLAIENSQGESRKIEPLALNQQVGPHKDIEIVRRGMRATVAGGTGRALANLPIKVAGKTGTAQFGTGEPHAWFTAFAPYDKPTIALAILVEEAGEGSDFSVPVAKDVLYYYFTRDGLTTNKKHEN